MRSTSWPDTREIPTPFENNRRGRRGRLEGAPGRGTLEKEKPPILGPIERGGQVVMRMLPNVRQKTIEPIIDDIVKAGSIIYTDEYDIYARLPKWGFAHETVCHAKGEDARDDDGDGFCQVHVDTMDGCWSLSRSWLRPHRGISQDELPTYLGFFAFVHNARKRGKTLLAALVGARAPAITPKPIMSQDLFANPRGTVNETHSRPTLDRLSASRSSEKRNEGWQSA